VHHNKKTRRDGTIENATSSFIGMLFILLRVSHKGYYTDREGVVTHIDDAGQIHGTWGGCAIVSEVDEFIILDDTTNH
jgi:hypothetical protein